MHAFMHCVTRYIHYITSFEWLTIPFYAIIKDTFWYSEWSISFPSVFRRSCFSLSPCPIWGGVFFCVTSTDVRDTCVWHSRVCVWGTSVWRYSGILYCEPYPTDNCMGAWPLLCVTLIKGWRATRDIETLYISIHIKNAPQALVCACKTFDKFYLNERMKYICPWRVSYLCVTCG